MNTADYLKHDAVGLAKAVASKEVTATELAKTAIEIIETLNPTINAVICKDYERALEAASRPADGPLAGVPFLLKDVYLYTEGMPTTWGSRYLKGSKPRPDSTMVQQWRRAGLTILGKTNAPEFAAEFVTEPLAYGKTINPWNAGLTVGGSSGGAAAAVASGMVPLAHATDLGGSIRIPAACCGLYGFKPTAGLNSSGPYFKEIAHGLNSDHVLTRSVRDSAASLDVTAESGRDAGNYLGKLYNDPGKLRIVATVHAADGTMAGANQVAAVEHAVAILRDLGHDVVLRDKSPLTAVGDWFDLLWIDDIAPLLAEQAKECGFDPRTDELEPMTWAALHILRDAGEGAVADALRLRAETAKAHLALFEQFDVLLTPSLASDPGPLGTLGFSDLGSMNKWAEAGYSFAPFSILANVSGQPAASLPLPMAAHEVPVGVQIMAAPHRDLLILQLSRQIEASVNWAESISGTGIPCMRPCLGQTGPPDDVCLTVPSFLTARSSSRG
ncbi:amidase [Rhizobium sp. KVB221]|uniref:Indoleacetamide hydrolase n=1 Tax=Rhizobium setariae TaxID=2801340 RepID=A0A936YVB2_9HYPH|nr:amidase [Rhizobium setariae]MBL0373500.1 amidase [Rhizobium setariae]